jgi:hypothetical protein
VVRSLLLDAGTLKLRGMREKREEEDEEEGGREVGEREGEDGMPTISMPHVALSYCGLFRIFRMFRDRSDWQFCEVTTGTPIHKAIERERIDQSIFVKKIS